MYFICAVSYLNVVWYGICARERTICLPACLPLPLCFYQTLNWTRYGPRVQTTVYICGKSVWQRWVPTSAATAAVPTKTVQDAHHFHFDYFVRLCIFYETCWCMTIPVWLLSCFCLMNIYIYIHIIFVCIYMYNMYLYMRSQNWEYKRVDPYSMCMCVCESVCTPLFICVFMSMYLYICFYLSVCVFVYLSELNVISYTCENLKMNIMADAYGSIPVRLLSCQ